MLGALVGSSATTPFRVGAVQENLRFSAAAPALRTTTIQDSLDRLIKLNKVAHTEIKTRHAYYLTPSGEEETQNALASGAEVFDRVLARILPDTAALLSPETAAKICRAFFCECFARFGRQIARFVIGQYTRDDLVRVADIGDAFRAAIKDHKVSPEARESLEVRCLNFIHSNHPDDQRLKYYLTHGFYFVQLLGYEVGQFDPLAKEAYRGATLFIDTNVLLPPLVLNDHNARMFEEVVRATKRLSIEMRITRATIDEIRRVAQDRANILNTILPVVPIEILRQHRDPFVVAFLERREKNQDVTVEAFMQPFDNLASEVEARFGITVEDVTEDEIINGRDVSKESLLLQDEATRMRGWSKNTATLLHDVAHLRLVADIRADGGKAWFLTRDRSVAQAAARLVTKEQTPPAFGLLGSLCTMSPFLAQSDDNSSLTAVFSSFLTEQVYPLEQMFDPRDLRVLAQMYDDVFTTPTEQLIPALDFVKRQTLKGSAFNSDDLPQVARALRGFLTNSADERERILRADLDATQQQQARERAETEKNRADMEARLDSRDADIGSLRMEFEQFKADTSQIRSRDAELERVSGELSTEKDDLAAIKWKARFGALIIGWIAGILVFLFEERLSGLLRPVFPGISEITIQTAFRYIGAFAFALPTMVFVRHAGWRREVVLGFTVGIVGFTLLMSRVLQRESISLMADLIALAMVLGTAWVWWSYEGRSGR